MHSMPMYPASQVWQAACCEAPHSRLNLPAEQGVQVVSLVRPDVDDHVLGGQGMQSATVSAPNLGWNLPAPQVLVHVETIRPEVSP